MRASRVPVSDRDASDHAPESAFWRWTRRLFLPLGLALVVTAGLVVPLPVYAERPGSSLDLTECVVIDDEVAEPVNGDLLLTFASYRRATVADLLVAMGSDTVLLRPVEQVVPTDTPPDEYWSRERVVFDDTARRAAAIALERAGYPEPSLITGRGARVVGTVEGFPADGVLEAGDVIVEADGEPVRTSDDLREAVLEGEPLDLGVHRRGDLDTVRLTPVIRELDGEERPLIGAQLETVDQTVELPLDIDVRAGNIGGPSAGLMIALQVYDAVAEEDLVAGRRIAGTGEISTSGEVGRVGALQLKVAAAAQQGASLFLVPDGQVEEARAAVPAGSELQVLGVSDLDEAIAALRRLPGNGAVGLPEVRFRSCAERLA